MSDLISRQEAFDEIIWNSDNGVIDAKVAIEALRKLPSVEPERKTGKWIPVSERLPGVDCGEYVLISINGQTTMARISGGANWGRGVWSVDYCAESGEESEFYHWSIIDAWMPLPEPYEEVEE